MRTKAHKVATNELYADIMKDLFFGVQATAREFAANLDISRKCPPKILNALHERGVIRVVAWHEPRTAPGRPIPVYGIQDTIPQPDAPKTVLRHK